MTLRDDIKALTPSLRRYARAIATGHPSDSATADDLVHATLMRALGSRQLGSSGDLRVRLFATVTQLHREMIASGQARATIMKRPALVANQSGFSVTDHGPALQTKMSGDLMSLPLEEREALLLVALEGFDHGEAARILRISRSSLIARLTQARSALETRSRTRPPVTRRAASHLRIVR